MSKIHRDYIPKKDSELVSWGANFNSKVAAGASRWGIPSNEVTNLQTAYDAFVVLQRKADSPDSTTVIVAEKNAARDKYVELVRAMAGFRLKNPIITDAERLDMGLHVYDNTKTTVDVPKTRPELFIEVVDFRRLKVSFQDQGSKSKAKPYGVDGAVIVCAVLDTPPADHSALTRSVLATRTPHILEFTEEERGKTVYIAICWQNEKGQMGPWSEIISAIVP
ncbi:MAG: hypothetical protein LBK96_00985 [Prevotellaceae bacterium]|jgi:hypothetical protein|nr:hypothetical protein [Prevotellaceae bacterium]